MRPTRKKTLSASLAFATMRALPAALVLPGLACAAGAEIASTAAAAQTAAPELPRLLERLSGPFDNLQQMSFVAPAPASAKINHYEAMRMQAWPFSNPQLEGRWLYGQTDKIDAAEGGSANVSKTTLYRQILQQFFVRDGQLYSRAWRFNDPALKQQGLPSPAFLQQLTLQQISPVMPEPCLTHWTVLGEQFIGRIDPARCVLQSKYKNEKRRLFSEEIVFPSGIWFREGAYGEDGSLAFGLEPGYYVRFKRLPASQPSTSPPP